MADRFDALSDLRHMAQRTLWISLFGLAPRLMIDSREARIMLVAVCELLPVDSIQIRSLTSKTDETIRVLSGTHTYLISETDDG